MPVRVVVADPPAFTPPYDHELSAALARAGAQVELVTSRFRFGAAPEPEGDRRGEPVDPLPPPVCRRDVAPAPDGGKALFFGVIRPYRGLDDAVAAARRAGASLIVAGDPVVPVERVAGVDYRLGYLSEAEVDRAHAEATVAVFPYRPELDQSGSLLRALGSGVPAVVYDVGGLAEPVERYGAG